jgi:hypothetical protein
METLASAMEQGDGAGAAHFDATYARSRAFFVAPPNVAAWAGLQVALTADPDGSSLRALGLGTADVLCLTRVWRRAVEADPALGESLTTSLASVAAAAPSGGAA